MQKYENYNNPVIKFLPRNINSASDTIFVPLHDQDRSRLNINLHLQELILQKSITASLRPSSKVLQPLLAHPPTQVNRSKPIKLFHKILSKLPPVYQ
ncbi:hypothetical protein CDL15_Pgr027944 [Punica granatum]|uniref:Uncharacterized protein n=1 Tax=Punica granatum TaxID=22663 RepID=A0A218XJL9_PUNGR|nr:hypothetical protein CDL15_Pgr027944 [Punica granatum]